MSSFRTSATWLGNDANAYLSEPFSSDCPFGATLATCATRGGTCAECPACAACAKEAIDTALAFRGQPPQFAQACTFDSECGAGFYCSAAHMCHATS